MKQQHTDIVITAFYKFQALQGLEFIREKLLDFCNYWKMKGTILIAHEGINSTISGSREAVDALYKYLDGDLVITNMSVKESFADFKPFAKMKVKIKREIVTMGITDIDVDNYCGTYLDAEDWDKIISDPNALVVDTRNNYEVNIGTFKNAVNPETKNFRQFPEWVSKNLSNTPKDKPIAMFCTGGIRCEKSTAYLKQKGFENVYHLKGGVLQYFEDTHNQSQAWMGDCFVFDERVAVTPDLEMSHTLLCKKCQKPLGTDDVRGTSAKGSVLCVECAS